MTTDAWGIDDGWLDTDGHWHSASNDTIDAIRAAMGDPVEHTVWCVRPGGADELDRPGRLVLEDGRDVGVVDRLPEDLPLGIHELVPLDGPPTTTLLAGPGRCHRPDGLRAWGVTVQVPTARSSRSWGIGDLADVRAIGRWIAGLGGDVVALSPLHSPTPVPPLPTSPYSPSSRRWRSPLLLRVDEVGAPDERVRGLAAQARELLADPRVHRDECWALQRAALEHHWEALDDRARADASRWATAQGSDLERWAVYCALAEVHGPRWRHWPADLRHPESPAVARTAADRHDRVAFHGWLQQLVEVQLASAAGAGVRLIQDLAVGVDPDGADAWAWQELLAHGFSIGAPPDEFQADGQSWGLPPWIPWRLRAAGYRPLAGLLRAAMLADGGLRIDHVMGLTRLFWVPEGGHPRDGAYVRFNGHELLDVVALESARAQAIVVGEDLGTVEAGLREELQQRQILSTKVVWFESEPPETWPELSLAMVTTHDLPTLAGMTTGTDAPPAMRANLERLVGPIDAADPDDVAEDVHRRLGASPSTLALATLEDLVGVEPRPNVPGTTDDVRPNWSLALPTDVDGLPAHPRANGLLHALAETRSD